MGKHIRLTALALLLGGCAGLDRGCSAWGAENFGSDWIIVQHAYDGRLIHCWALRDVSVANESASDGIYWTSTTGNLVHIGGWYTRVQVADGNFKTAAADIGVDLAQCH